MKKINNYIFEKLKISSSKDLVSNLSSTKLHDTKVDFKDLKLDIDEEDIPLVYADEEYPDDRLHRKLQTGKDLIWWKFWKILAYNGPTTKKNLNLAIGTDNETSYSTIYARMNKFNVITYNAKLKCLEAQPVSRWKV